MWSRAGLDSGHGDRRHRDGDGDGDGDGGECNEEAEEAEEDDEEEEGEEAEDEDERSPEQQHMLGGGASAAPADNSKPPWPSNAFRSPLYNPRDAAFAREVAELAGGRYVWEGVIGGGGYGSVAKCHDKLSLDEDGKPTEVAVKRMEWEVTEGGRTLKGPVQLETRRLIREVQILKAVKHPHLIHLLAAYSKVPHGAAAPREGWERFDVYLVFELMDQPLSAVIRKHVIGIVDTGQPVLECWHVVWLMYCLLSGLYGLHSAGVTHRDIKPHNLLIRDRDTHLHICDFGLARARSGGGAVSDYVQTRWYRCPELLWQSKTLEPAMDVWSVGCVLAELLTGEVLFRFESTRTRGLYDGDKASQRLLNMLDVIGVPTADEIPGVESEAVRKYLSAVTGDHLPSRDGRRKLKARLWEGARSNGMLIAPVGEDPETAEEQQTRREDAVHRLVDLADQMLQFDPRKRPEPEELLKDPVFEWAEPPEACSPFDDKEPTAMAAEEVSAAETLEAQLRMLYGLLDTSAGAARAPPHASPPRDAAAAPPVPGTAAAGNAAAAAPQFYVRSPASRPRSPLISGKGQPSPSAAPPTPLPAARPVDWLAPSDDVDDGSQSPPEWAGGAAPPAPAAAPAAAAAELLVARHADPTADSPATPGAAPPPPRPPRRC